MIWQRIIRRETGLLEHICEHGIGHPAWGSADWMAVTFNHPRGDTNPWLIHGCDGCCGDPEWQLTDLREGVMVGNKLIMDHKQAISELVESLTTVSDREVLVVMAELRLKEEKAARQLELLPAKFQELIAELEEEDT